MTDRLKGTLYIQEDPLAQQALALIRRNLGITGWQLAIKLQRHPDEVQPILANLARHGLVNPEGTGLSAYYAPSGMGFSVSKD